MKIFFKITVIALITVLGVLSCAPEVGITERDMKEVYAYRNPEQIGASIPDMRPVITGTPEVGGGATADKKELTIKFPVEADVLQKSTSEEIQAELEKFLSFHAYTDSKDPNTASNVISDILTTYTYVRRDAMLNQTEVIICLDKVPSVLHFVAKFNENYTYGNGYKVNLDDDNAKEPIYGDFYIQIDTTGGEPAPTLPEYNFVHPGHQNWNIKIGDITAIKTDENKIQAVFIGNNFWGSGWFTNMTSAEEIAEKKAILEGWKDKFELQRWDGSAWIKADARFLFLNSTTNPHTDLFQSENELYVVFTPADLTAFRIVMNGTKDLTTEKEYYGQKQKIAVTGYNIKKGYFHDTVAGQPGFYYNPSDREFLTSSPLDPSLLRVTSDSNGKNVVVDLVFLPISLGSPLVAYWPKEISQEEFKKNIRFIYSPTELFTIDDVKTAHGVVIINIDKVTYGTSPYTPNTNTDNIKVGLDPNYRFNSDPYGFRYVLVAPGFKYTSDKIVFGDYNNWDFEIDGVKYWNKLDLGGLVF